MAIVNQPTKWIRDSGTVLEETDALFADENGDLLVDESNNNLLVSESSDGPKPTTTWEDTA